MIIGVGLLMTYIDGDQRTVVFILSLLFIASGIIITISHGEITFNSFYLSFIRVIEKYWLGIINFCRSLSIIKKMEYLRA